MIARKPRVLIVDDEASVRSSLAEYLEDFGMETAQAGTGEDALALIARNSYDIVIADMRLSGMTGETVIASAHRQNRDLRFIIHTGSVTYTLPDNLRAIGLNTNNVFTKPVGDMHQFVAAINNMMK